MRKSYNYWRSEKKVAMQNFASPYLLKPTLLACVRSVRIQTQN
jgi:hypothetical protein